MTAFEGDALYRQIEEAREAYLRGSAELTGAAAAKTTMDFMSRAADLWERIAATAAADGPRWAHLAAVHCANEYRRQFEVWQARYAGAVEREQMLAERFPGEGR